MINLNEQERLNKLLSYNILDTPEENDFDELVNLASSICKTPISLISLIDDKRQWFKAHFGLADRETPREISFCHHAIKEEELFVVADALLDVRFKENPLVTGHPDIRFYAGMPLTTTDGYNLGTLCVIDTKPRFLTDEQKHALKIISKQVTKQLDLKLSYQNIKNYNELLEEKQTELKEANATKDKIFSIVAHDLRAPLRNIKDILDMYNSGELDMEEFSNFIKLISDKVNTTTEMLENLLSWAKSQLKNSRPSISSFSINGLITKELNKYKKTAEEKGIQLKTVFNNNIEINADAEMVTIVFRNLLSNAIKFSRKGDSISVEIEEKNDQVIINVQDTGKGISEENLAKLFNEAEYISTFGTNNEKGIGIGLHLCKTFLQKNKGSIWVNSTENVGSTFSFAIPIDCRKK